MLSKSLTDSFGDNLPVIRSVIFLSRLLTTYIHNINSSTNVLIPIYHAYIHYHTSTYCSTHFVHPIDPLITIPGSDGTR